MKRYENIERMQFEGGGEYGIPTLEKTDLKEEIEFMISGDFSQLVYAIRQDITILRLSCLQKALCRIRTVLLRM